MSIISNCPKCDEIGRQSIRIRYNHRYLFMIHSDKVCRVGRVRSFVEFMRELED